MTRFFLRFVLAFSLLLPRCSSPLYAESALYVTPSGAITRNITAGEFRLANQIPGLADDQTWTGNNTFNGNVTFGSSMNLSGTPTGGTLNLSFLTLDLPTVPVTDGGTGATTASGARTNLGATTLGANLFTLTNPGAVTFLRVNADNTVTARTAAQMRSDLALAGEVYVGPSGNDSNAGTYAAPLATLDAAVTALGGRGTIWMLGGTYTGAKCNLANAKSLTIAAIPGSKVKVLAGTAKAAGAWTAYTSGGETHTWRTALATAPDSTAGAGNHVEYIYEWGVPRYTIAGADRDPAWGTRTSELEHYPLPLQTSIANVEAASAGGWYYSGGFLYVRTSTGTAPSATIYVPDNIGAGTAFVYGASATAQSEVTVQGIEVYFAEHGFDFSNVGKAAAIGCTAYGVRDSGINAVSAGSLLTRQCSIFSSNNDGITPVQLDFSYQPLKWISEGDLVVRCADKGFVAHENVDWQATGGFAKGNAINWLAFDGASGALVGCRSRNGSESGFNLYPHATQKSSLVLTNITSDGDNDAVVAGGDGCLLRMVGGTVRGATRGVVPTDDDVTLELIGASVVATTRLSWPVETTEQRVGPVRAASGSATYPSFEVGGTWVGNDWYGSGWYSYDGVYPALTLTGTRIAYANSSFFIWEFPQIPVNDGVLALGLNGNRWSSVATVNVDASGTIKVGSMADAAAGNGTIYYSTDASKLVFKDSGGTVHALY